MNLYGIPAAGISVLLGNYHNCPPGEGIAEEFVSLDDVKGLVRLITETVARSNGSGGVKASRAALRKRLEKRLADHRKYGRAARKHWSE